MSTSSSAPSTGSIRRALQLSDAQARAVLSVARAIAQVDDLGERTGRLLDLAAETLEIADASTVRADTTSEDLKALFASANERRTLVDAMILVVCIEGEVRPARRAALERLSTDLGVTSPFVRMVGVFESRSILSIKRGLASRSPDARRIFARIWAEEGVLGLSRALWFVLGLHRDPALAARFRALSALPAGTFGRAVAEHFAARGLAYPGERGGVPERMMHHDLMHVINGYDTDSAGECEIGGFYLGFTSRTADEPFTFIMTALATFHLGLRVSPAIVQPTKLAFDPRRVLAAFLRGRRLKVDVMGAWDYWSLFELPIEDARGRLGIGDEVPLNGAGLSTVAA